MITFSSAMPTKMEILGQEIDEIIDATTNRLSAHDTSSHEISQKYHKYTLLGMNLADHWATELGNQRGNEQLRRRGDGSKEAAYNLLERAEGEIKYGFQVIAHIVGTGLATYAANRPNIEKRSTAEAASILREPRTIGDTTLKLARMQNTPCVENERRLHLGSNASESLNLGNVTMEEVRIEGDSTHMKFKEGLLLPDSATGKCGAYSFLKRLHILTVDLCAADPRYFAESLGLVSEGKTG